MRSVYEEVRLRGGVAPTYELIRAGLNSYGLTRAVRRGDIVRARQGHYVTPDLPAVEIAAVRVGGRLTGVAGARQHGLWSPLRAPLHVAVAPHARALRSPLNARVRLSELTRPGVRISWASAREPGTRSLVGVRGCLLQVARTEPSRVAFATIESALHLGKVGRLEWTRAARSLPRRVARQLTAAGRLSESGGESLARFGMLAAGIPHQQQVFVAGVGRIDFLVGERLVVEVDGAAFHTSRAQFEEDRRRDAVLSQLGYRVLRFSYTQVSDRWDEVLAAIRAAMARGDHRG